MADVVAPVAETLDVKSEQLKDLQVRWLENSRAYIHDNPVKSLGITIVGGFLLSRLLSSRWRRSRRHGPNHRRGAGRWITDHYPPPESSSTVPRQHPQSAAGVVGVPGYGDVLMATDLRSPSTLL